MLGTILSLVAGLLKIGNAILRRMSNAKLRESGATKEIARASLALLKTLEAANAVDAAILDDDADPDWMRRVIDRATGGKGLPDPGDPRSDGST